MKKILIKIYTKDGINQDNFLGVWTDATFKEFNKKIDGGLGQCVLILARKFDDYDEYNTVNFGNLVEIIVGETRIYKGFIASYRPHIENGKENIEITLLSSVTKLPLDIYKNGTTTTITESATEIGQIIKNIITRYRAEVNTDIYYTVDSINDTSQNGDFVFKSITYLEAINKAKNLAPDGWYWYIDENGLFYFKEIPSTPTHSFTIGKNISLVDVRKTIETVRNILYLYNGTTYKRYEDSTSVGLYGKRAELITDINLNSTTTMDNYASRYLAEHKDPQLEIILNIIDDTENDKGYDIESINPLDTCQILGLLYSQAQTFNKNMLITNVMYSFNKVVLTLQPIKKQLDNDVLSLKKDLQSEMNSGLPSTYTT